MVPVSGLCSKMARAISIGARALSAFFPVLRADELKLKDGTTITGTIVGFEENSFKVKTSYGFAEIQKDQVVSISISDAAKKPEPEKKAEPATDKSTAAAKPTKTDAAAEAASEKPAASAKPAKTEGKNS